MGLFSSKMALLILLAALWICCMTETNDTCPPNFTPVAGTCLSFKTDEPLWTMRGADKECEKIWGKLATIRDPAAFSDYTMQKYPGTEFWLSASDVGIDGVWRWLDGSLLEEDFPWNQFHKDDPDNNCMTFTAVSFATYSHDNCLALKNYVCDADATRKYLVTPATLEYPGDKVKSDPKQQFPRNNSNKEDEAKGNTGAGTTVSHLLSTCIMILITALCR